jgi:heme-degrading monooxygenase HmoA
MTSRLPPPETGEKGHTMFSVIFEVLPAQGKKNAYLDLAKHLKPILESTEGFVENERFECQLRPGWLLSHSTWRDEKSLVRWRTEGEHHSVQEDYWTAERGKSWRENEKDRRSRLYSDLVGGQRRP